ncbi:MAG: TIGR00730 family Rossman fold protein [Bacillota bacterium]
MNSLGVFCGSSLGVKSKYKEVAEKFGNLLAREGIRLVYGGGSVGIMGILADAALRAGGEVVGVIPRALWNREVGHRGLTELYVVETMHQRKSLMADLSDGFVALPGGIGTMEEIFEVWTWAQLGIHRKPCGLLEVDGFFAPLLAFINHMVAEGFLRPEHRFMLIAEHDSEVLLEGLRSYCPPAIPKWLDEGLN